MTSKTNVQEPKSTPLVTQTTPTPSMTTIPAPSAVSSSSSSYLQNMAEDVPSEELPQYLPYNPFIDFRSHEFAFAFEGLVGRLITNDQHPYTLYDTQQPPLPPHSYVGSTTNTYTTTAPHNATYPRQKKHPQQ
eukprot:TRINITY_DN1420_c0_g1_i2.p1 TRINITY_DN1420_c0_g1~~TRINITY_DN1420_c0_g1_i2.p1  ORF type:complete len:133 (+),score=26.54 TRINITY_DN1420_c0_g1_i2:567-965(+)